MSMWKHTQQESTEIFGDLKMVPTKVTVFWDVTPCGLVAKYRCSGGTCCLQLKARKVRLILLH
jgi:hypothetical protein